MEIIYELPLTNKESMSTTMPCVVLVRIPNYTGPAWWDSDPKLVPLEPVIRRDDDICRCSACEREGFPLMEAEAATIHTSQGTTVGPGHPVQRICINIGDKGLEKREPNAAYVAGSRSTIAAALCFTGPMTLERFVCIGDSVAARKIDAELERLGGLAERTRGKYQRLLTDAVFTEMLAWAEERAAAHGVVAPYVRRRTAAQEEAP